MDYTVTNSSNVPDPDDISRRWWDREADAYIADSPSIGEVRFQWTPEGWTEDDLHLIGPNPGHVLEVGAGTAPCSRFLASRGIYVTASDISSTMLDRAHSLNAQHEIDFPLVRAAISNLPFDDASFDTVFTSFGAIGFISDLAEGFREVARVLTPGGRWIFAATHPFSWVFPDSPHVEDLSVVRGYGRADAYVESDDESIDYAEFSHTFADYVNALKDTGFSIETVLEPLWKPGHDTTWSSWGPERGALIPGSLIISARLAAR